MCFWKAWKGFRKTQTIFSLINSLNNWIINLLFNFSNSALGQPTDKLYTVLERGHIAHEDPTIRNQDCLSQESGMSFMSPKGHILTFGLFLENIDFDCLFVCLSIFCVLPNS